MSKRSADVALAGAANAGRLAGVESGLNHRAKADHAGSAENPA